MQENAGQPKRARLAYTITLPSSVMAFSRSSSVKSSPISMWLCASPDWDHGEAIGMLIDAAIEDDRFLHRDHLADRVVELGGFLGPMPTA